MFNLGAKTRPYFGAVVLTTALLTAGGIYSYTRMPSSVYPEVTFPRISLVAQSAGLDVRTMEVKVTQPLEQAVSTVLGVAQVRSKTIRGGSELSINFNPGTDIRRAETLTWNRIGAIRSQLPPNVDLTVEQMTPSVFPILSLVLTGGDSDAQRRDYAFYQLAPRIKNVPDVLYAKVAGGDLREIEVEVRPDDLLAAGMSAADLADQIGKAHRLQAVGRIEQTPLAFHIIVNTQGETARQIEDLVIAPRNNQPLRVRDVADVKVSHSDRLLSIGSQGRDAVVITVFRRLGGNTVNISRDIKDLLAKQKLPANIQAEIVYDQADFVDASVHNVRDAILVGGLFSILILLAFLRSWRATLISALAIPTTLAITFLVLHWSGETLNLMSLGGLAVAIGLVIDDTVVVVENIARHLAPQAGSGSHAVSGVAGPPNPSSGKSVETDPVSAASSEITGAVVGSTLTTVLVFLPLAFITGVYGQFFASLSWSLAIAVLVSMVISLTLVPVFAAKFLAGRPMPGPGPIYRSVAYVYEFMLSIALRFPWVVLGLSVAAVGVGIILFTGIPDYFAKQEKGKPPPAPLVKGLETGLMPSMDEGAFIVDYWAPAGTPLEETERMAKDVEDILSQNPDVKAFVRRTGAENGLFATQTYRGDIQVALRSDEVDPLRPWSLFKPLRPQFSEVEKEMKELGQQQAAAKYGPQFTPAQMLEEGKAAIRKKYRRRPMLGWIDKKGKQPGVMDEVEDEIKSKFGEHQLKVELVQIMADELNDLSGANKPVEVKVFGPDHNELRRLATMIGETLEKKGKNTHRGIKEVNSNVREGNPDLLVLVDGVWSARGLTSQDVERQLTAIYLGQVATQVQESAARVTDVRVRYPNYARFGAGRFSPDLVLDQRILLPEGLLAPPVASVTTVPPLAGLSRTVPLSALAKLEPRRTPDEQWRENQQPAIFVTADIDEEEAGLGSVVDDIHGWMSSISLPSGYRWEMGGHYIQQKEAFRSLLIVMIVAILLVFIMLAFQFQSVVLPMLIFLTQPLSLVSGLFALWLTNTPLNVSSYMGAILLIGLDMKNGILLVEYIQQLRREGMELRPALLLAGRTRFRPILMTSLAAILGLLPLALGIGPGAQMQQPLAIMVIGGLTANMLFTRMIIPVGYLVLEQMKLARTI
ncbi:MAG TPA: efflux RND transporter permease subunit [Gemmataceae bacterium]|nr:efflux RND transporter permease subunit [Gemmataceae bacterium]